MTNAKKQNTARKRKRKWNGVVPSKYRNTTSDDTDGVTAPFENVSCASSRKLDVVLTSEECNPSDYFIAFNFELLKNLIAATSCPVCLEGPMTIVDLLDSRKGFCHLLELKCTLCSYSKRFHTSPVAESQFEVEKKTVNDPKKKKKKSAVSKKPFEINLRSVIAFREIGAGHESMKTFSLCMNMHCLTSNGYNRIKKIYLSFFKSVKSFEKLSNF